MCAVVQRYSKPQEGASTLQKKYGPKTRSPDGKLIKIWYEKFKETGTCLKQPVKRLPTVHREVVIKSYEENPRQSIRRAANHLGLSYTAVRDTLKDAGYKPYRPHVVQTLNQEDYGKRVAFAEWVLNKKKPYRLSEIVVYN